jgi:hypothetical protein
MEMLAYKSLSYDEYNRLAEEPGNDNGVNVSPANDNGESNAVSCQSSEILKKLRSVTGEKMAVATGGVPQNVGAFINTDTKEKFINETLLTPDNFSFALHATRHEMEHERNSIFSLPANDNGRSDHLNILQDTLGVIDLEQIDLVEGFNELITFRKHGKNDNSGYLEFVRVANDLDKLCVKTIGVSLVEVFEQGKRSMVLSRMRKLCDRLLVNDVLGDLKDDEEDKDLMIAVEKKFDESCPPVESRSDAVDVVQKVVEQEKTIIETRKFLQKPQTGVGNDVDLMAA